MPGMPLDSDDRARSLLPVRRAAMVLVPVSFVVEEISSDFHLHHSTVGAPATRPHFTNVRLIRCGSGAMEGVVFAGHMLGGLALGWCADRRHSTADPPVLLS